MNKFLGTLAVLSMAASVSFASNARVEALGSSIHLTDAVTIFANPSDANKIPDAALIEYGPSSTLGSAAKGGFVKSMDTAKMGFFLGAGSEARTGAVTTGTTPFEGVENPFTVVYGGKAGDMGYGVAFSYSASAKKEKVGGVAVTNLDSATQSKMGLTGSVDMGDINFGLNLGLADTAKTSLKNGDTANYAGTDMGLFAYYAMDTMTFGAGYSATGTKIDKTESTTPKKTTEDSADSTISLSFVNQVKKEGADFFYGATYYMNTNVDKAVSPTETTTTTALPVLVGVEADAASWLVLRGSITQNVLLGGTTVKSTASVTDSLKHNTTVNAGMGLKFNKSMLDMTLSAAGDGKVAANAVGAKAAYTYLF